MKLIYVWWDKDFTEQFQRPLLNALHEVIELGEDFSDHFEVKILGNFIWDEEQYRNADSFFDSSFDPEREQVNASSVLNKVGMHWPFQPHKHVIGTSHDLWSGKSDNRFVFGWTMRGFGTIISSHGILERYKSDASVVYMVISLHENAHLFKAPDEIRRKDLNHNLGAHCKLTDCALGQVNLGERPDVLTSTRSVLKRYQRTNSYFCSECTTDIVKGKRELC